jgi:hypothetical protein
MMLSSSTRSVVTSQLKRIARTTKTSSSAVGSNIFNHSTVTTATPCIRLQNVRQFSVDSSATPTFSSYEYPTRSEAPEITTTKASDTSTTTTTTTTDGKKAKIYTAEDPFDDGGTLTIDERENLKAEQSKKLGSIQLSSLPITNTVPDFIPPNVSSNDLEVPETMITTLENGIRVVSQETYSQMCTVGVLTNVGSRHESVTGTVRSACIYCIYYIIYNVYTNKMECRAGQGRAVQCVVCTFACTPVINYREISFLHRLFFVNFISFI